MTVPGADGCDFLVNDGGDATLLIHKGKEFEEKYAKDGSLPEPSSTTNAGFKCILQLLKDSNPADKTKYTRRTKQCNGVSEETTKCVHWLWKRNAKGERLLPAINVNDCVTKSKFDYVYGCRHPCQTASCVPLRS
jgi:adenosylhomocysteinase